MTDKVSPSPGSVALGYQAATAIRYGGQIDGWVVPEGNTILADTYSDISTPVGEFGVNSYSDLTVTVDSGEGFVGGANVVRDVTTDVDVPSEGGTHYIYLGSAASANNTVIIDTDSAFSDKDSRIELIEVGVSDGAITGTQYIVSNSPSISNAEHADHADNLGAKPADSYAVLSEGETITGNWEFDSSFQTTGFLMERSDDGLNFGVGGQDDDRPFIAPYVDGSSNFNDEITYENGNWRIETPLNINDGDWAVSSGSQYEIQKNGSDGAGIINFKT